MGRKRLRDSGEAHLSVRLRIKEDEKEIIERMVADGCRLDGAVRHPTRPQAVVSLLRIGLNCLRYHVEWYKTQEPISEEEAVAMGLRLPGRRNRRKAARRAQS